MDEWRVEVSVRVSPQRRIELEQCAGREKRTFANFGALLLEWGFEQFKMVGSPWVCGSGSNSGVYGYASPRQLKKLVVQ